MDTNKANETFEHFLEFDGFEIIERDWSGEDCHIDYICLDLKEKRPCVVFLDTFVNHRSYEYTHKTSEEFERVIAEWAKTTDIPKAALRYDTLLINVISESHALIKHGVKIY